MPGIVANVLLIPKSIPENGGAMSAWFTIQPGYCKPKNPTPTIMTPTAAYACEQFRNVIRIIRPAGTIEPVHAHIFHEE